MNFKICPILTSGAFSYLEECNSANKRDYEQNIDLDRGVVCKKEKCEIWDEDDQCCGLKLRRKIELIKEKTENSKLGFVSKMSKKVE